MRLKLYKSGEGISVLEELDNNSSSILKSHKTKYNDFFYYWMNIINNKNRVVDFYLDKNDLHISIVNFKDAFFEFENLTIIIDDELLNDVSFRKSLETLIDRFKRVKYETRENIKFRKKEYYKDENIVESIDLLLNYFNQNKSLPNIDDDLMIVIYHYIRQHEKDLEKVEKKVISNFGKNRFIVNMIMLLALSTIGLYSFICSLGWIGVTLIVVSLSSFLAIERNLYKNNRYFKKSVIKSFIIECRHRYFGVFKSQNKNLCNDVEIAFNEIFDFISSDFLHMRHRTDIDYKDLIEEILVLKKRFAEAIKDERENVFSLMNELIELELTIFSRKDEGFPKNRKDIVINKEMFDRRLAFLGYDVIEDNNPVIDVVHKVIDRIESFPYEGCELEVLKLLRIVVEEINCGKGFSNPQKIFIKINKVEKEVTRNINDNYAKEDSTILMEEIQIGKRFLL